MVGCSFIDITGLITIGATYATINDICVFDSKQYAKVAYSKLSDKTKATCANLINDYVKREWW